MSNNRLITNNRTLIIFIGLQASGKSTFFRHHFAETHELVSKDLMRNNKNRSIRQAQLIEQALQRGSSVVVDNTNPTIEERKALIELGKQYDAQIIGYFFESEVQASLERNSLRSGKARVPSVAIYTTIKKLELPVFAEGFHKLFYVRIIGNWAIDVCEWKESGGR
jgi:predicted kinase